MIRRALLLAAGRGARLAPLTDERPKCLVPLLGRPLLEHQLAALRSAGIADIAIVGGYHHDCLRSYTATLYVNERWQQSNMVVSLLTAAAWFDDGDSLVCYTDILYSPAAIAALAKAPGNIALSYDPHWLDLWSARFDNPLLDAESFSVDAQGRLVDIGSKTDSTAQIGGQYMGLVKLTRSGWQTVANYLKSLPAEVLDRLDMTALFARLLTMRVAIDTVSAPWPWAEVDTPADLVLYGNDPRFADLRRQLLAINSTT
jgi:L-glutamine-phosphate cytidylyltransferase